MLLNVKHLVLGEKGDSNESPSWVLRRKIDRNRDGQVDRGPRLWTLEKNVKDCSWSLWQSIRMKLMSSSINIHQLRAPQIQSIDLF